MAEFAANDRRLSLLGVLKETGKADEELIVFYQDYFRKNSLYKDEKWRIYNILGNPKIGYLGIIKGYIRSRKRFQEKGMPQAKKQTGDSFTSGGTMVFNKRGELFLTYNTEFEEYDMNVIAKAVEEARMS